MLRILAALALVVVLAVGAASGSSPSPPLEVTAEPDGTPVVGGTVSVTFTVHSNIEEGEILYRLEAPAGLRVLGSPDWSVQVSRGSTHERTWDVRVEEEGFWALQLVYPDPERKPQWMGTADGSAAYAWCCQLVWVGAEEGQWGGMVEVFEHKGAVGEIRVKDQEGDRFHVTYTATPRAAWLRHAELSATLWSTDGSAASEPGGPLVVALEADFNGSSGGTVQGRTTAIASFVRASGDPVVQRYEVDCTSYYVSNDWRGGLPGGGQHECHEDVWYSPSVGPAVLALTLVGIVALVGRRLR